jgi:hypothetical protein
MKAGPYIQRRIDTAIKNAEQLRAAARVCDAQAADLRRRADEADDEALRWAQDVEAEDA